MVLFFLLVFVDDLLHKGAEIVGCSNGKAVLGDRIQPYAFYKIEIMLCLKKLVQGGIYNSTHVPGLGRCPDKMILVEFGDSHCGILTRDGSYLFYLLRHMTFSQRQRKKSQK